MERNQREMNKRLMYICGPGCHTPGNSLPSKAPRPRGEPPGGNSTGGPEGHCSGWGPGRVSNQPHACAAGGEGRRAAGRRSDGLKHKALGKGGVRDTWVQIQSR